MEDFRRSIFFKLLTDKGIGKYLDGDDLRIGIINTFRDNEYVLDMMEMTYKLGSLTPERYKAFMLNEMEMTNAV